MEQGDQETINVIVVGDPGVGKTSLLCQIESKGIVQSIPPQASTGVFSIQETINFGSSTKMLDLKDYSNIPKFGALIPMFFRGVQVIPILFDITNRQSFDNVLQWPTTIRQHADKDAKLILVGNKCDLDDQRVVSYDEAMNVAMELGCRYVEISSKHGFNVRQMLSIIASEASDVGSGSRNT